MKKLFVYGTLMSGLDKEGRMNGAELTCAECRTSRELSMYIYEGCPFVFEGRNRYRIKGELYEVPDDMLKYLDEYEGDFYFRKMEEVECGDSVFTAFMYFGRGHFFGMKEVSGGDYRKFSGEK
ncbi:MAG: gamma-glutamylcyclotransferase [Deferribacterales bacterium]